MLGIHLEAVALALHKGETVPARVTIAEFMRIGEHREKFCGIIGLYPQKRLPLMATTTHDQDTLPESATTHDADGLPLMSNADFRAIRDGTLQQFSALPADVRETFQRTKRWLKKQQR
jgi:hypothetical protein